MRDRPAEANKVTKKSRNGSRGANAKARSAKRARKFKSELNGISASPGSGIASEVDDEARTLDQSKSSKQKRGRPQASKDQERINGSVDQANDDGGVNKSSFKDRNSNGDDTRRQLSELQKEYSILEARYQELQDLGVKKAEENFERLRAQAEENTKMANKLIAQLKEEIAEQSKSIQQAEKVQVQLRQSETETGALRTQLAEANQSLSQAKSEMKTLYTKLAASRHIEPSNNKGSATGNRAALAEKENKQAAQQVKEDLYADLTGLIVRDVRRIDKQYIFDCIQTGRNGTLHFKLALEGMDSADSYEDVQFAYLPQLNASRDGELIEVLPDYLTEEITFPRNQASRFYSKVIKSLMVRLD